MELALAGLLVMLAAIIVNVALVSSPSGVKLHETGKMKVVVEDKDLLVCISKPYICQGDLNITYSMTSTNTMCQISGHASDFPTMLDDNERTSICPLQKSPDDIIEVNVVALPSGCTVTLTDAKLPGGAETQSSGDDLHHKATIGVIVLLVVLVIVCSFLVGCYFLNIRRKKRNSTTAQLEPTAQKPNSSLNRPTTTAKRKT